LLTPLHAGFSLRTITTLTNDCAHRQLPWYESVSVNHHIPP
jgi:hypothetical protein